ncbi:MAG TPA: CHAD domain-containing protein, partial [Gemmataceae bacterium]|nr:CHAD domain-containing protein [Gemmataceae bacterium]
MAEGKWIDDLDAGTPLDDAARHVLTVRLEVVRDHLAPALHEADKDPEHVHQLRVATRRAGAAVDLFAGCLPDKAYNRARKALRKVRRAAGAARDWDVFLLGLAEWPARGEAQRPGLDFLAGYATGQRLAAQDHLRAVCADQPFAFDRLRAETVAAVHAPHDADGETLLDLARPLLAERLRALDEAAAQDLGDYDNLHQVRIAGKRLRYAMEVFASCFAPAFKEELYPAVEEMQEILGNANDSHVAAGRLEALRARLRLARPDGGKRFRPGLDAL